MLMVIPAWQLASLWCNNVKLGRRKTATAIAWRQTGYYSSCSLKNRICHSLHLLYIVTEGILNTEIRQALETNYVFYKQCLNIRFVRTRGNGIPESWSMFPSSARKYVLILKLVQTERYN